MAVSPLCLFVVSFVLAVPRQEGAAPAVAPPDDASRDAAALLDQAAGAPAELASLQACVRALALEPAEAVARRAIEGVVASGADGKTLAALVEGAMRARPSSWHETLWDAMVERLEDRDARGWACWALAQLRLDLAQDLRYLEDATVAQAARDAYAQQRGARLIAAARARGAEALRAEGLAALRRVSDDFYLADHRRAGYLGALADAQLFELERLQPGQVAPEIEGADEDGVPFKLSDYRGKVVLLDFWGFWCPICRHNLPDERVLVERLKDAPFALVGVNSDSRAELEVGFRHDRLSWRSFFDGGDPYGPIARRWNVLEWPTLYVLDAEGVILWKGEHLDGAIRAIDAEVARLAAPKAAVPERAGPR